MNQLTDQGLKDLWGGFFYLPDVLEGVKCLNAWEKVGLNVQMFPWCLVVCPTTSQAKVAMANYFTIMTSFKCMKSRID